MADETPLRAGATLDLSSGTPGRSSRRARKGPPPLVVQTINLSTRRDAPAAEVAPAAKAASAAPPPAAPASHARTSGSRSGARAARGASGGTSLADLLDEATLARLRGGA